MEIHRTRTGMTTPAPLYIVASPRPRVGKTLMARLLIEFLRSGGRSIEGYDLHPREPALAGRFPKFVLPIDIGDTRGQMQLFDRLLASSPSTKVIDVGYGSFDLFFSVTQEIGFIGEARRRQIEPTVLFIADPSAATANAYAELRDRLATTTFVPVHNESVSVMFAKEDFPVSHPQLGVLRIPRLSPIVRGVIDRPSFSFAHYMTEQRGGPTEVHHWISTIFTEFREFELRLLMTRVASSLSGGTPRQAGQVG